MAGHGNQISTFSFSDFDYGPDDRAIRNQESGLKSFLGKFALQALQIVFCFPSGSLTLFFSQACIGIVAVFACVNKKGFYDLQKDHF
jgi:hypothetical protein